MSWVREKWATARDITIGVVWLACMVALPRPHRALADEMAENSRRFAAEINRKIISSSAHRAEVAADRAERAATRGATISSLGAFVGAVAGWAFAIWIFR